MLFAFEGVQCIETSQLPYYKCGSCPSGWTGNGTACHDIDEVIISCSTLLLMHYLSDSFLIYELLVWLDWPMWPKSSLHKLVTWFPMRSMPIWLSRSPRSRDSYVTCCWPYIQTTTVRRHRWVSWRHRSMWIELTLRQHWRFLWMHLPKRLFKNLIWLRSNPWNVPWWNNLWQECGLPTYRRKSLWVKKAA